MAKSLEYEKIVTAAAASKVNVVIVKDDPSKVRGYRPESESARWIEKNLTSNTLLSNEDLRLSEKLCLGLGGNEYEENRGTSIVPLGEDDLLAAIADLDASTEALNLQTQALEAQRTHFERQNAKSQRSGSQIFVDQIKQKKLTDIQRLKDDIFEGQDEVEGLFRTTKATIDRSSKRLPAVVFQALNSNDRTLDNLEKGDLAGASTEQTTSTSLDKVERLTTMLSRMIAEELQTRLNRVYLENLQETSSHVNGDGPEAIDDVFDLEQDLRSLFTEIPDVAEMFVTQKYKEPLIQAVQDEQRQRKAVAALHSSRVTDQLAAMAADLEQLTKQLHTFHSYRCVMQNLQTEYEHFARSTKIDMPSPQIPQAKHPDEFDPVMERMLRHFGLPSMPSNDLHELICNKVARLRDSGQVMGSSIEVEVKKTLEQRRKLVESLQQGVDLNDEAKFLRLNELDARITRLREEVETVSGADASGSLRKQRAFIEKWF